MRSEPAADRGDIVLGWLARLTVILVVFGVIGYDGVSLLHTGFTAADAADRAAAEASDSWVARPDIGLAYAAAQQAAVKSGGTVPKKTFSIDHDGTVHAQVRQTATTFLLHRIGPLRHYAVITSSGIARPPS